jgi:hypothetical protein
MGGEVLHVIIGLFKDGIAQELNDASVLPIEHEINYLTSVEYISVFRIHHCKPCSGWKGFVIPGAEVDRCFQQMPTESTNWEWP